MYFAVHGGLRCSDLTNIKISDVEDIGFTYTVSKNDLTKFEISTQYYNIIKKYVSLRLDSVTKDGFFLNYRAGQCTNQLMDKKKLNNAARMVAKWLNLDEPYFYNQHTFK